MKPLDNNEGQGAIAACRVLRRMGEAKSNGKEKSHAAPASSLCRTAQPVAQADVGCALALRGGFFPPAPLSSVVGRARLSFCLMFRVE